MQRKCFFLVSLNLTDLVIVVVVATKNCKSPCKILCNNVKMVDSIRTSRRLRPSPTLL